ncbi:MAG: AraC family transcriptional regulator, partial [Granulosicoccaceae bacterium]
MPDAISSNSVDTPYRVAMLLMPDFPLMAFSSTIEPLRAANLLRGEQLFEWRCVSLDGEPVLSSSGISINCEEKVDDSHWAQILIVCAGPLISQEECKRYHRGLNLHAKRGCTLAGISSGAVVLGSAGLLDGYRCTAHWEYIDSFAERFPLAEVIDQLYVIDRKRLTCSGGTAAMDM